MITIGRLLQSGRRQLHTIISRETIKPSSPTPSLHYTYNLSELDQIMYHKYIPLILLYPHNVNCSLTPHDKAAILKQSLSRSLTQYYPFAGTIKPSYVECNDEGVVFVEAKNDSQLTTYQKQHITIEDETLDQLFVDNLIGLYSPYSTNVVGVQLNHFACGGVALAVSMSHTLCDASTVSWFVNHWAYVARYGSTDHKEVLPINPHFIHSPYTIGPVVQNSQLINQGYVSWSSRRFVFPNSKLRDLKNKCFSLATTIDQTINKPTRVEVLTSLLYKTAVAAATKKSGCYDQSSVLYTPVNIRNKFIQKLPQNTVGNLLAFVKVPTRSPSETSLSFLVSKIKKEKLQLEGVQSVQHAAQNMRSFFSKLRNEQNRTYHCSSLCGFPYNKVDFGWGKPMCATMAFLKYADKMPCFQLMDTVDGDGIEAIVFLDEEEMEIFANDKEMLSYCQTE